MGQVDPVGHSMLVVKPELVTIWQHPNTVGQVAPLGQLPLVTQAMSVGHDELVIQPVLDGQTEFVVHP